MPTTVTLAITSNLDISVYGPQLAGEVTRIVRNATVDAPVETAVVPVTETEVVTSDASVAETDPVTFTATITPAPDDGWVVFESDQDGILGAVAVVAGEAELEDDALSVNDHVITASYTGSANFGPSSGTVDQEVTA